MTDVPANGIATAPDDSLKQVAQISTISRVIGLSNARTDHQIVAGAFSLGFHLPKCNPAQRIEPIDCPGNLRDQMGQTIQPLDVRQFVRQRGCAGRWTNCLLPPATITSA